MANSKGAYKGSRDGLRARIKAGSYESVGLYDKAKQTNGYLGAVPGFKGGRKHASKREGY